MSTASSPIARAFRAFLPLLIALLTTPLRAQSLTIDDARADFTKGDYRSASDKAGRMLTSSLQQLLPSDRYDLLMLRGESQLQLKDRLGAATSFKSASKVAGDVAQLAAAKANALVIEASSMGKYTPRTGDTKDPIDIVPADSRKQAMSALEADLWRQNKSQVDAAGRADSLPPIEKVFIPLSDMFFLETAATGKANDTGTIMRELGQRAYRLMQTEVTRASRRVEGLTQIANSTVGGNWNWGGDRRGLWTPERNELKDMVQYMTRIRDRAVEYRTVASKLGGDEQKWDALVADSTDALMGAQSLLNNP